MTDLLNALVGEWTVESRHPGFPGLVVAGRARFEWLEGEHFLIQRAQTEHPDFPDSLWVIGGDEIHYFDSRGVRRVYGMSTGEGVWRIWRDEPGFRQRFEGRLSDDGDTFAGVWELARDDEHFESDLEIAFRRT